MAEKNFKFTPRLATPAADAFERTVKLGEALDIWALSPIDERSFTGEPELLTDPQRL